MNKQEIYETASGAGVRLDRPVRPPRCRRTDETADEYRVAMGWDKREQAELDDTTASPWRPMRSAPKDGTAILALLHDSDIAYAIRWSDTQSCWVIVWDGHLLTESDGPRYWMAIPDDPDT